MATETDRECWLDTKGVIVLGDIKCHEHMHVALSSNTEAQGWLDAIPDAQREWTRRAVTSELARAAERIKHVLVRARDINAIATEAENLRWILSVISQRQDGASGSLAMAALDPSTDLSALRQHWMRDADDKEPVNG